MCFFLVFFLQGRAIRMDRGLIKGWQTTVVCEVFFSEVVCGCDGVDVIPAEQ